MGLHMLEIDKDTLYRLYVDERKPMHKIAKELNIAIGSVYNYLKKYGIATRDKKQTFTFKGVKLTNEQRIRISKMNKGKKLSDETKKKLSDARFREEQMAILRYIFLNIQEVIPKDILWNMY